MKKIFFLGLLISLFSFLGIGLFNQVSAADDDSYTLKINSKGMSSDRILIMNWAFSGDYKEMDIYSSINGDYYRFVDTVEIKKGTYNYHLPCGIQLFWFKFVPKVQQKIKGKTQYKYGKEFEYKTNVNGVGGKCRPVQSAAAPDKLNASYYISGTSVVLTWTATSGSSDIEVKVAKNSSDTFSSLAIVPMSDEKYVYNPELFDRGLRFALVPRDLYGEAFVYSGSIMCFNRNCGPQENLSTVLFGVLQHSINEQRNQIIFQWDNKLAGVNVDVELFTNGKFRKIDTVKLMDGIYTYKYGCGDKELLFKFSLKEAAGIEYLYAVEVDSSKLNCSNTGNTAPVTKGLSSDWYWFVGGDQLEKVSNGFTRELDNAFKFGSHYNLTSARSIENANMNGNITRAAMAKMISNFAKNALGLKPDTSVSCSFPDVPESLDRSFGFGITEACQLGIMGIGIENFKPYDSVYRAEFGTILSRLVFGLEDGFPYYQPHLHKLYEANVMKNIEPYKIEKRGNVLLMLMRAAQTIGVADGSFSKYSLNTTESVTSKIDEEKTLFTIVELVNPKLLDLAKQVLVFDWNSNTYKGAGADLTTANICHTHTTGNNVINFYWDPVILSDDVEIRLYTKDNKFSTLSTVDMNYGNYKFEYTGKDKKLDFSFTPRNAKGKELFYTIDYHQGSGDINCKTQRTDITDEVKASIEGLGKASNVLGMLVSSLREKDSKILNNLKNLMSTYKESENEFTKNLGVYMIYLLNNL